MRTFVLSYLAAILAVTAFSSCDTLEVEAPGLLVPLTVDQDPTLPSIFVNGTQLHAEAFGNPNDPMIMVIHGGPGSDYRGMLTCSTFAQDGFYVVFYDQRGSGLSKRHPAEIYTGQLFIDDLDAVIRHYRQPGQKVILMGLSWGAMLATAYVNEYPAQIDGVIMMEPGGFTWEDTKAYVERWSTLELFDETSNDFVYLDQFITGDDHAVLDYKAGIRSAADFAKGNKVGIAGPVPFWRMGAVCNSAAFEYVKDHPFDFTKNLSSYTTRVLFAYSELNEAYGRDHAVLVSSAYPNVELVRIDGTGHEIPYFGWEGFYTVAKAYLATIN